MVFSIAAGQQAAAFDVKPSASSEKPSDPPKAPPSEQRYLDLVEEGKPVAEIVVAPERPRMVTLAALELQNVIQRMSGARLPIVTQPTEDPNHKVYLGKSEWTEEFGVSDEGLKNGAYRIATGPDWIAVVGSDFDFAPPYEPWPRRRGDIETATAAWDEKIKARTGSDWAFPFTTGYKGFWSPNDFMEQMQAIYGKDVTSLWQTKEGDRPGFWNEDEGGTFHGVQALLGKLGVRWYMPGELGEVIPETKTVSLPETNEIVKPEFPVRIWYWYNYQAHPFQDVIWGKRVGMNSGFEQMGPMWGPHGLTLVHGSSKMQKNHPEYYALLGGKRDTEHRGYGTPCFTSDGFYQETVKWLRFLFDEYDFPMVDIWPVDGLALCQCEGCGGKPANELVWEFVDRVSRELYKTHPDHMITCGAYANYREAPTTVDQFTPNVGLFIGHRERSRFDHPPAWEAYQSNLDAWKAKLTSGKIIRGENNRLSIISAGINQENGLEPLVSFPVIHPRNMAKDLRFLKGVSIGEFGEVSFEKGTFRNPGIDHLTLYVQSRLLWDPDQDLDALLDDYYEKFYGPAAAQMKEALTFAEGNYSRTDSSRGGRGNPSNVSLETGLKLRELLASARKAAGDTIYGQRVEKLISELLSADALIAAKKNAAEKMAAARAKARTLTGSDGPSLESATAYDLLDATSKPTQPPTSVKFGWEEDFLTVEFRCEEPDMANLQVTDLVWDADHVAIALETPDHSYYKIEVNPDGSLAEGNPTSRWKSLADVKTERGEDFWMVRLKIPVVGQEEGQSDPLHRAMGSKPTEENPWFVNVGRMRIRDGKVQWQSLSPAGAKNLYSPEAFSRLEIE